MEVRPLIAPELEPDFVPAALWNRAFRARCATERGARDVAVGIGRPDGTVFRNETRLLADRPENAALNARYLDRLVKFLLYQKGGSRVWLAGAGAAGETVARAYAPDGARAFDWDLVGRQGFLEPVTVRRCVADEIPRAKAAAMRLGRHLDGFRIGFDIGGSDRKAAAVADGKVVFSEEIAWDPYFQKDPAYHYAGINDSLRRAAAHLPRVDAIGGSAAGVYVNNEVRLASLFRGVSEEDFARSVRGMFLRLREEWGGVPFEVINDGEVTALAGSMALNDNAVLGLSMGTSLAAGYCDAGGHITPWLDELAFAPVDYRADAPADEWSGDRGCGVSYFSQQAVARLAPAAGIALPDGMPFPERLARVQGLMRDGDPRARRIYGTIGVWLGYAVAHYADFYDIRHLLVLGRVTSGPGGDAIVAGAQGVLRAEFPALAEAISITMPDETMKRHGQAVAAASLPETRK